VTANEYLNDLLNQQQLQETELNGLRTMRDTIQKQLSVLEGNPRFYYAASYGKLTIIRQRYDLDIVMYWPSDVTYTIKGIYDAVGNVLKNNWKVVNSKTASWRSRSRAASTLTLYRVGLWTVATKKPTSTGPTPAPL
jgi:hypothetical protein